MAGAFLRLVVSSVWCLVPAAAFSAYSILIDAGSTGSRIHIFRHKSDGHIVEVAPHKDDAAAFETEPGLSSYSANPEGAGHSLGGLLRAAADSDYVPKELQATTPLWVKCTAGMRYVDRELANTIIADVTSYLSDKGNCPFDFINAEIIAGDTEAIFEYIAVNDLLGYKHPYTGIIELGGASAQWGFNPAARILMFEHLFYMDYKRQSIFGMSYNGFGLDEAKERALVATAKKAGTSKSAEFPCFSTGQSTIDEINGKNVTFSGTSDPAQCSKITKALLHADYECTFPPCGIKGSHQPPLDGEKFIVTAGFFYTANLLGLVEWKGSAVITPGEIISRTTAWCKLPMEEQQRHAKEKHHKWKYAKNLCFAGSYIYHLLRTFGFTHDDKRMTFALELNGGKVSWTLGAVLFEREMPRTLPQSRDPDQATKSLRQEKKQWQLISIGLGITAVLCSCFACGLLITLNSRSEGKGRGCDICLPKRSETPFE